MRRVTPRASSSTHIKARLAGGAGAEHAYLFDAQLLMLDDRMLIDRAVADHRDRSRSTPNRRCSRR